MLTAGISSVKSKITVLIASQAQNQTPSESQAPSAPIRAKTPA
jgi:hypothetical protein